MNRFKLGLPLAGLLLVSGAAAADEIVGQVGIVSEYMFRGIESSDGAALQGSLDWSGEHGLSGGAWASNTADSGTELDLWAGWGTEIGEFGVDAGLIYYYYSEADETLATDPSYAELYLGGSLGPMVLRAYFTDDFAGTDEDGLYIMGAVSGELCADTAWSVQVAWPAVTVSRPRSARNTWITASVCRACSATVSPPAPRSSVPTSSTRPARPTSRSWCWV